MSDHDDEGPELHPIAEAVLEELEEDGTLGLGAIARIERQLAGHAERTDLPIAVEALIAVAEHAERNLRVPATAGALLGIAVRATPALHAYAERATEHRQAHAATQRAAFARFRGEAAPRAPHADAGPPPGSLRLSRVSVPTRFR